MQDYIFNIPRRVMSGKTNLLVFLSMILFGLTTCKKDDVATRDYPRVYTLAASEITEAGAKFNAEIISGNPSEVIEYGFAWSEFSTSPTLENSDHVDTVGSIKGKTFSSNSLTLQSNKTYHLRSFIKTNDLLIYGRVITFTTLK
jgi:hypothetical protein